MCDKYYTHNPLDMEQSFKQQLYKKNHDSLSLKHAWYFSATLFQNLYPSYPRRKSAKSPLIHIENNNLKEKNTSEFPVYNVDVAVLQIET